MCTGVYTRLESAIHALWGGTQHCELKMKTTTTTTSCDFNDRSNLETLARVWQRTPPCRGHVRFA